MYEAKLEENETLINSLHLEQFPRLTLRYIVVCGNSPAHYITQRKKIEFLKIFDYVKPEEYEIFKKI